MNVKYVVQYVVREMLERQLKDEIKEQPFVIEFVSRIDKRENITGFDGIQLIFEAYEPYRSEPNYHDAIAEALDDFKYSQHDPRPSFQLANPQNEAGVFSGLVLGGFSRQLPDGFEELIDSLSPAIEQIISDGLANYLEGQDK